jgi:hypothetical protein
MDPELYNKCEAEYEQQCVSKQHESELRRRRWDLISQQASKRTQSTDANHASETMQLDQSHPVNIPERIVEEDEGVETSYNNMALDNEASLG